MTELPTLVGDRCPAALLEAVEARLRAWPRAALLFWRASSLPAPLDGGAPSAELHAVLLLDAALLDVRAATDGFSESLIPLRAIDRLRLIRKPDRTQVEIRHGDCISWLERKPEDEAGADLETALLALQHALGR